MSDLKPNTCPFCAYPEFSIVAVSYQGGQSRQHVRCPTCGAQGPAGVNSEMALELWCARQPAPPAGPSRCPYCESANHTQLACPRVKAFDFHEDRGGVKRVEFKTELDYFQPVFFDPATDTLADDIKTGKRKPTTQPFMPQATSSDDVPTS